MLSGRIRGCCFFDPIDRTGQFDDRAFPLVGIRHDMHVGYGVFVAHRERIGADIGIVAVIFPFPPSRRAADLQVSRQ